MMSLLNRAPIRMPLKSGLSTATAYREDNADSSRDREARHQLNTTELPAFLSDWQLRSVPTATSGGVGKNNPNVSTGGWPLRFRPPSAQQMLLDAATKRSFNSCILRASPPRSPTVAQAPTAVCGQADRRRARRWQGPRQALAQLSAAKSCLHPWAQAVPRSVLRRTKEG
jgi:hypothetical protein